MSAPPIFSRNLQQTSRLGIRRNLRSSHVLSPVTHFPTHLGEIDQIFRTVTAYRAFHAKSGRHTPPD